LNNELELVIAGDSAAAPPAHILEGLSAHAANRPIPGAPHTIYEELWHIAYWQQMTLDWIAEIETPFPDSPAAGFPPVDPADREDWPELCARFFRTLRVATAAAAHEIRLDAPIRCPSRPGQPVRIMTVREQLESLGAHNHYHFGRIVLLRQLMGLWPPPAGGYSW
jgi:uncharacterized damage-inducible protein DinB